MVVVAALYKFVHLGDVSSITECLINLGKKHSIRGTLILSEEEGINGTVAGSREGIDALKSYMDSLGCFKGWEYKESFTDTMPFFRFKILNKKEIVTFGVKVDPQDVGEYIEPEQWNDLISNPDVITIDTRNHYEVRVGTFKGAVDPKTSHFREFADYVKTELDPQKHKKVAMFCTGGIRCEKSTAYLKSLGFENVYHLKGGILRYLERVPEEKSLWEGECFVFDQRVCVAHGLSKGHYDLCCGCREPLTEEDKKSPHFEIGVSCPRCYEHITPSKRKSLKDRQKQMDLARQRGEEHLGRCHLSSKKLER